MASTSTHTQEYAFKFLQSAVWEGVDKVQAMVWGNHISRYGKGYAYSTRSWGILSAVTALQVILQRPP